MAYTPLTFVAGEILTATKMNLMSANDASFHDGTGIDNDVILSSKIKWSTFSGFDIQGSNNGIINITPQHDSIAIVQSQATGSWGFAGGQIRLELKTTPSAPGHDSVDEIIGADTVPRSLNSFAFYKLSKGTSYEIKAEIIGALGGGSGTAHIQAVVIPMKYD